MSSISSRPRVHGVDGTSIAITCGAILVGALIKSLSSSHRVAKTAGIKRQSGIIPLLKNEIKPITFLREEPLKSGGEIGQRDQRNRAMTVNEIKASTLEKLIHKPYFIQDKSAVKEAIVNLRGTIQFAQAVSASDKLIQLVEREHQAVFSKAIQIACTKASLIVGFKSIKTMAGPGGKSRVIADDGVGRALVTEIDTDSESKPMIQTEVVGVFDGTCDHILDEFDKALDKEGVKSSSPQRKFTGGACELEAAREFVMSGIEKEILRFPQEEIHLDTAKDQVRRAQRLNQANPQRQLRK